MSIYKTQLHIWNGLNNRISYVEDSDLSEALNKVEDFRKNALLDGAKHDVAHILYQIIEHDEELDIKVRAKAEEHIKNNTFEDFFYEMRGYHLGEKNSKQFKKR